MCFPCVFHVFSMFLPCFPSHLAAKNTLRAWLS
jgi:hypothetical protein